MTDDPGWLPARSGTAARCPSDGRARRSVAGVEPKRSGADRGAATTVAGPALGLDAPEALESGDRIRYDLVRRAPAAFARVVEPQLGRAGEVLAPAGGALHELHAGGPAPVPRCSLPVNPCGVGLEPLTGSSSAWMGQVSGVSPGAPWRGAGASWLAVLVGSVAAACGSRPAAGVQAPFSPAEPAPSGASIGGRWTGDGGRRGGDDAPAESTRAISARRRARGFVPRVRGSGRPHPSTPRARSARRWAGLLAGA